MVYEKKLSKRNKVYYYILFCYQNNEDFSFTNDNQESLIEEVVL